MSQKSYEIPDDCRYTRSDEWVRMDGARARIGITDYAQSELSDIVFVEAREVGSQIEAGDKIADVESVKAVAELYAPFSGEIVAVHKALAEHPEWINEDPYGRGWVVAMVPDELESIDALLSPEEYAKHVQERARR
jgi:glycine cleavage system H protein